MVAAEAVVPTIMDHRFHRLAPHERLCVLSMALLELAREEGPPFPDPGLAYLTGLETEEYEACLLQLHCGGWITWTRCARVKWIDITQP